MCMCIIHVSIPDRTIISNTYDLIDNRASDTHFESVHLWARSVRVAFDDIQMKFVATVSKMLFKEP